MSKFHEGDRVRVALPPDPIPWAAMLNGGTGAVNKVHDRGERGLYYTVIMDRDGAPLRFKQDELRPTVIEPQDSDTVDRPNHYKVGMPEGVEVIDVIRAQDAGFEHANVIKYILRWKYKGTPVEDLRKARKYLDWLIEKEDSENDQ